MTTLSGGHLAVDFASGSVPALLPFFTLKFDLSYTATAALMLAVGVRAFLVLSRDFPLNDGALFVRMTDELAANGFRLPTTTSYNDAGIPFAYSPLAFYGGAFLHAALGVDLVDVVRFVPLVFSALCAVAFWLLARDLIPSRVVVTTALCIFAVLPRSFLWLIMGGGLTRAPGFFFAILALWDQLDAFAESNRRRAGQKAPFVFYDGPPFATGTPHYGHLLAGTIKDIVPRYWNMRGHPVPRRFGWDCHGLPIEALAQQALGLAGAASIVEHGVGAFNEQCRSMVQTYVAEWRRTVTRMGRWVDFDSDYKTMDPDFMESVWWVFKRLWDDGRVYKSYRVMPYSWKLATPLSNFEISNSYKEVQDPAITLRFRVTKGAEKLGVSESFYLLAWTTTPWTLPSNLALCAGPGIEYSLVRDKQAGAVYAIASARLAAYYKNEGDYELVRTV